MAWVPPEAADTAAAASPAVHASDRALLELLARESPAAFVYVDQRCTVRHANRAFELAFGVSAERLQGAHVGEWLPAEVAGRFEELVNQVLTGARAVQRADFSVMDEVVGRRRDWHLSASLAEDDAGRPLGAGIFLTDRLDDATTEAWREVQRRSDLLQQVTGQLAGALTVRDVAKVVVSIGRMVLNADRSAVVLFDGKSGLRAVGEGSAPADISLPGDKPFVLDLSTSSLTAQAIRSRKPAYLADGAALLDSLPVREQYVLDWLAHTDERAWVAIPLITSDVPLGVLRFAFLAERTVEREQRPFLEALAAQCALAVERAQLFQREHDIAETLQRSLLPEELPETPYVALAADYRPGSQARIGGDWYDAFALPDGKLALVVGDVMGHGIEAAAGMGRMRSALRALAFTDSQPTAVLSGLDRLFEATEGLDQLVTLVYLVFDPAARTVELVNAGHPPVVLVSADGVAAPLWQATGATPLGWPQPREQFRLTLHPGDRLLAFTDGLVETRTCPSEDGVRNLACALAGTPVEPGPQALVNAALQSSPVGNASEVGEQAEPGGVPLEDDVTVLALQVLPNPRSGLKYPAGVADRNG